jgi:hypothetical protein
MVIPFIQRKDMKVEENINLYTPKLKTMSTQALQAKLLSLNV